MHHNPKDLESIKDIKHKLTDVIKKNDPLVSVINGKWGVGKTYFWHDFIKSSKGINTAYISLFGKDSIEKIRSDILMQVASIGQKFLKKISSIAKDVPSIPYINAGELFSILEKKDFKNIIVCFDDFERMSEKLRLEDICGLISELKEQKECKIVMILNIDKLKEDHKVIIDKYKEKIVDYAFYYDPTPQDCFNLVKDKLDTLNGDKLEEYLKNKEIKNLRIIMRIINTLNDFSFIEERIKDHDKVRDNIINCIISIATINAKRLSFDDFMKWLEDKLKDDSSDKPQEGSIDKNKYDDVVKYVYPDIDQNNYHAYFKSDIVSELIEYCKTSIVNKEKINKIVIRKFKYEHVIDKWDKLDKYRSDCIFDMQYDIKTYISDTTCFFEENGAEIIIPKDGYYNLTNFITHILHLIKYDSSKKAIHSKMAINYLKYFMKKNFNYIASNDFEISLELSKYKELDNYEDLDKYRKELIDNHQAEAIKSFDYIKNLMTDYDETNDPEKLKQLSLIKKEDIKNVILKDKDFVMHVLYFLGKNIKYDNCITYSTTLKKILEELVKGGTESHKVKAERILSAAKESRDET